MTVKNEGQRAGEFIVSEGNGAISREKGTLASGQNVVTGRPSRFLAASLSRQPDRITRTDRPTKRLRDS